MSWNRKLWGVCFVSKKSLGAKPFLIGTLWDSLLHKSAYKGEPSRVLLFTTREDARAWCQKKNAERHYGKFFPVRVRETVVRI